MVAQFGPLMFYLNFYLSPHMAPAWNFHEVLEFFQCSLLSEVNMLTSLGEEKHRFSLLDLFLTSFQII